MKKHKGEDEINREKLQRLIEKNKDQSTALKKILESIEKENQKDKKNNSNQS